MIVGHGTWLVERATFFLWAESSPEEEHPSSRDGSHPFHLNPDQLQNQVFSYLGTETATPVSSEILVRLPSNNGGPIPSLHIGSNGVGTVSPELKPYRVRGLELDPLTSLRWLVALPPLDSLSAPSLQTRLGADLHYWSEVARFSLELLSRQRFLPSLAVDEEQASGRWDPLLEDEVDRLEKLISAMPPVCRAVDRPDHDDPGELVRHCIATLVDVFVRQAAARLRLRPRFTDTAGEKFLASVLLPEPELLATDAIVDTLHEGILDWHERLNDHNEENFKLAFRLEAPGDVESAGEIAEQLKGETDESFGRSLPWELHFFLQAVDDESLMVPVSRVWEHSGRSWEYVHRRMDRPQERVLTELSRAASLFEPIERSLKQARPESVTLNLEEAHGFLTEAAILLRESGFSVQVPTWWGNTEGRLGVRLRVRPQDAPSGSATMLGLSSIVQFDWQVAIGEERLERQEFLDLVALKQPLVRVRGQWVELVADQVEEVLDIIASRDGGSTMTLADVIKLRLRTANQRRVPLLGLEAEAWVSEVLNTLTDEIVPKAVETPPGFEGSLRPYQEAGLSWLYFMGQFGLGACLADDMGLGKTIQVLALLSHLKEKGELHNPFLVICPTSIVSNWRKEAERFTPDLRVHIHHGLQRLTGADFARTVGETDLVVSTYSLVHRDFEALSAVSWEGLVLDEAQNIKNTQAKQTKAVRKLGSARRLALTGTPVENRLSELWSIMEFLNPGYLGSESSFRRQLALPIERYRDPNATAELSELVRPFLLRRLKTDPAVIRDLPEKNEMKVYCSLTREQASLYEAVVRESLGRIDTAEGMGRRGEVLKAITRLKQICNHPAHYMGDGSDLKQRSGKLTRLVEMLEEVLAEGDRALVFTQYAEMGKLLQQELQTSLGQEILYLYGGVPAGKREAMIQRFQETSDGPPVFVLSLKAGGFGLNLTNARHVFHFDRWWNPAVEDQATDRVFRIGQRKSVAVHKFICAGTIEERIDELIERKKELAHLVITAGDQWLTELSTSELRDLFELRDEVVGA